MSDAAGISLADLNDFDAVAWARLSESEKATAYARLNAIVGYLDLGKRTMARASAAAETIGLSRPRFYALTREWEQAPSFSLLVPRAAPRKVKRLAPSSAEIIAVAIAALGAAKDASVPAQAVIRQVRELCGGELKPPADLTVRRHLADARRANGLRASSPVFERETGNATRDRSRRDMLVAADFGDVIVIDASTIDLVVAASPDAHDRITIAMVVDQFTGLILGWSVCLASAFASDLYGKALERALLRTSWWPATTRRRPTLRVVLVDPAVGGNSHAQLIERLRSVGGIVEKGGPRRVGRRLNQLLGGKLRGTKLLPRYTMDPRPLGAADFQGRAIPWSELDAIIEQMIDRHNHEQFQARQLVPLRKEAQSEPLYEVLQTMAPRQPHQGETGPPQ